MDMRKNMIENLGLGHVETTKWNEIYENGTHVFIFSKVDDDVRIKRKRASREKGAKTPKA